MLKALRKLLPEVEKICQKKMFVITSVGKSGSTWVQKILDSHPEIYCAGEGKFQTLFSQSLGAFDQYNARLIHTNQVIYGDRHYYNAWQNQQVLSAIHFLMALTFLNVERPIPESVKYIGDKDTGYIFNINTWGNFILPDTKFIHVIRDVRDAAISNVFHLKRQGSKMSIGDNSYYNYLQSFSKSWKDAITNTRSVFQDASDLYIEVHYEHLLNNPFINAKRLCDFLKVDTTDRILKNCCASASFEKLTGGRKRGTEKRNSFFRKGIAGDWKNHFDIKAKRIIYNETENLLVELGYKVE